MDEKIAVLIAASLVAFVVVYIVHSVRGAHQTREQEQTKREIAAFVAEGSISPDDGVKLLQAGASEQGTSLATIADGVAWGMISPAKGERLIRAIKEPKSGEPARV